MRALEHDALTGTIPKFQYEEINAMRLADAHAPYTECGDFRVYSLAERTVTELATS